MSNYSRLQNLDLARSEWPSGVICKLDYNCRLVAVYVQQTIRVVNFL
uniref:Uncharacterized protein n=1 Tax=Anguilla anguilla TaxID=7936 RepID=A0A0E9UU25_ANGAN